MRQTTLFTKTRKEAPADEVSKNAQLLIRAGFLHKEMAGVYAYLPLGWRVYKKIEQIIREEMNAIGAQELNLTTLQNPEVWKKSGRWASEEESDSSGLPWFKTALKSGTELGIANTHEEALTSALVPHISSYKDLPVYTYQFQNKFRNELRAKSGIMRCREFVMKDLYSFSKNEAEFKEFYERCAAAYLAIFRRVGLGDVTYRTFASGGSFSRFSDEFQTLSEAGEDIIYVHKKKRIAVNREVYTDDVLEDLGLNKDELVEEKSIEVGNIFTLGTRYSEAMGLRFKNEKGEEEPVVMGSYGIGLGRLLGTIVEVHADEKGIVWPLAVAPFVVHLINIGKDDAAREFADALYVELVEKGVEVLYDDRALRAGEKFAESDLLGIPYRIVVSDKALEAQSFEWVERRTGTAKYLARGELVNVATAL